MRESYRSVCLVIGGNYFFGFPLCRLLLQKGCRITWVSRLSPREKKRLNQLDNKNFLFQDKLPKDLSDIHYLFFFLDDNQKDLKKIIKAIKEKPIKLLVIAPAETSKKLFEPYREVDLRVVHYFDVYGPGMPLWEMGHLTRLFNQAITGGPLTIPGEGWEKIAPLYVDDLIVGLSQAIFSHGTKGKIFDLTGSQPVSLISLAYLLQKKSPLRPEIEYVVDDYDEKKTTEEDWQFLDYNPIVSLEKGVEKTINWFAQEEQWLVEEKGERNRADLVDKKEPPDKTGFKLKLPPKKVLLALVLWLLLLFSPVFFYGTHLFLGWQNFRHLREDIAQGDLSQLAKHAQRASHSLAAIQQGFDWFGRGLSYVGLGDRVENINRAVFLAKETAEGIYHLGLAGQQSGSLFVDFVGGEKINPQVFPRIQLELEVAITKLSLAQTILPTVKNRFSFLGDEIAQAEAVFPEAQRWLIQAREMSFLLAEILLSQERRTYLVLFQNNMELRPSGGFIGSFGLLTIEGGKLLDFEIHDVYFADGQLKGHVEPPAKLKEYIGQAGWYLRDSNWSPDFPTSARRAAWFLNKEIGRKVDGVMAIDLFLAERILKATGEIYLPDYDEKINADNFFEKAEYHSEAGFFPGSTQKQDFLGKVAEALFAQLKSTEPKNLAQIGFAFYQSLEEKDIIIYLEDDRLGDFIAKFNWDGGIKGAKCGVGSEKCFQDYVYINEANVGINKANYFLHREIEQVVAIDSEGKVKNRLTINYHNQSPHDVFPAGDYRNYLRVLLPLGSQINQVRITDLEKQGEGVMVETIDHETDYQREIFGFLVEVPVKEKRRVEIEYQLSEDKKVAPGGYLFLIQKQPGTRNDQYYLSISYPQNLFLAEINPQALTREGLVIYNTTLSKDTAFELVFEGKD